MAYYNPYSGYVNPFAYNYNPQNYMGVPNTQDGGRIYVQGEAAAKSYLVAANSTAILWDSEQPFVYIKRADGNGMPYMEKYRLVDTRTETAQNDVSEEKATYITREDLDAVYGQINDLRAEIDGLSIRRPSKKKEAVDDEQ